MEADDLASRLTDPAFEEAVGVLQMISRSPEDRQFYEARQKFLHDEQARLLAARQEGEQLGLEKGKLGGKIQMLEELLGIAVTTDADLRSMDQDALAIRFAELQQRLRDRQA